MAKITLQDSDGAYVTQATGNANNTLIEAAVENTLSRDGTSPNQMGANLDMNSHRVLNLPDAASSSEPATYGQLQEAVLATGSMAGPGVSVDNDIVLWDGTSGLILKDSGKTLPAGEVVGTTDVQTLSAKTLTSPVINNPNITNTGLLTLPTGPEVLVGRATTDTLTNKTLTSPVVNSPVISGGSINNTVIGNTTAQAARFTTMYETTPSILYYSTQTIPTGTASATKVMMGFGSVLSFTPTRTGRVMIDFQGMSNNSVAVNGVRSQLYYGTGAAPVNGAALTGTSLPNELFMYSPGAGLYMPFSHNVRVTGLTLSTAIWVDLAIGTIVGGTATVALQTVTIQEY